MNNNIRLYNCPVPLVGLSGGIASGKSTVVNILREEEGYIVICADTLVKKIYAEESSIEFIIKNFPEAVVVTKGSEKVKKEKNEKKEINFAILRSLIFDNQLKKKIIEDFIYPQMEKFFQMELSKFDLEALKEKQGFVIYDVPLLFEKKLENYFDKTVCVYASVERQLKRLVERDKIPEELAQKMLDSQMALEEKKKLADIVIDNNTDDISDLRHSLEKLKKLKLN